MGRKEEKAIRNRNLLEFVSQNGEELIRNIFLNTHNVIAGSSDYFWNILKNTNQDQLFRDEAHAFLALLATFISIRTEMEMQEIYEKYGEDAYRELGECVSSYYLSFLRNFTEDEEKFSVFLMRKAHETITTHEGKGVDILLAMQFKKISAIDADISPSVFHPLMPALSEGGTIADIIEMNI